MGGGCDSRESFNSYDHDFVSILGQQLKGQVELVWTASSSGETTGLGPNCLWQNVYIANYYPVGMHKGVK